MLAILRRVRGWWRELRTVGLRDWCWFVVVLRRDEFHPRLQALNYPRDFAGQLACVRDRSRAHRIDLALMHCAQGCCYTGD